MIDHILSKFTLHRILLLSSVIILLPYLIISFFNVPVTDDLCRVNSFYNGYWDDVSIWYNHLTGRYFNAIIALLPLYGSIIFKLLFIFLLGFFYYSSSLLIGVVFPFLSRKEKLLYSICPSIFLLTTTPSINSLYWFAAASVYFFSFSIFIILLVQYLKLTIGHFIKLNWKTWTVSFLLVFIGVGSSEITMVYINFVLLLFLVYHYINKTKWQIFFLFQIVFSIICSLFVIYAPGSIERQANNINGGNLLESIINASIKTIEYLYFNVFQSISILLLSIILLSVFIEMLSKIKIEKGFHLSPIFSFTIVLSFIFLSLFIYEYSLGDINIHGNDRMMNMVFYHFLLTWVYFIFSLAVFLSAKKISQYISIINGIQPYLISILFIFSLLKFNTRTAYKELLNGSIFKHYQEVQDQISFVQSQSKDPSIDRIKVPMIKTKLYTLYSPNITEDPEHWMNKCYCEAFANGKPVVKDTTYLKSK